MSCLGDHIVEISWVKISCSIQKTHSHGIKYAPRAERRAGEEIERAERVCSLAEGATVPTGQTPQKQVAGCLNGETMKNVGLQFIISNMMWF